MKEKIERLHIYLKNKANTVKTTNEYANDVLKLNNEGTLAFFEAMFMDELKEINQPLPGY